MSTELDTKELNDTPASTEENKETSGEVKPKPKKRRRRLGDRNDGRKIRTLLPVHRLIPYIMKRRSDALNYFADSVDVTKVDAFCRQKVKEGYTNFGFLHVLLAAYVRMISQRPAVNRFINGQKVYARNEIEIAMVVKKEMSIEAPETCIKVVFEPTDTVDDVYRKFNDVVSTVVGNEDDTNFDTLTKVLNFIPGLLLRWTVSFLSFLDYFGLLPRFLTRLSPFHGTMIVTSMGSLGINPIYHHLYDFGNLPVFIAYGKKKTKKEFDENGELHTRRYIEMKVVTDERICEGFYFASAFKLLKKYIEDPARLTTPPEQVFEDID